MQSKELRLVQSKDLSKEHRVVQAMRSRKDEDHPPHLTGGEVEQPKGVDDA